MAWAHQHQKLAVLWLSPILPEVNEYFPRKIQHLQLLTVATEYKYTKLLMVSLDSSRNKVRKEREWLILLIAEGKARMSYYADCLSFSRFRFKNEVLVEKAESLQDGILAWIITSQFLSLPGTDIPVSFVASALARVHLNRKSWGCNHFQCRKELALEPEKSDSGRRRADSLAWDQGPKVPSPCRAARFP